MKKQLETDVKKSAAEESAIAAFEELKAAKTKEIDALTKSIEGKMTRIGEIAVKAAEMGNELEDNSLSVRKVVFAVEKRIGLQFKIVGILKTMGDEMNQNLADTTAAEEAAIAAFEELKAAKTKEIDALTKSIEGKLLVLAKLPSRLLRWAMSSKTTHCT